MKYNYTIDDAIKFLSCMPAGGDAATVIESELSRLRSENEALKTALEKSCPCTLTTTPCSYACSCAHPAMSGGCFCCTKYGDEEQRAKAAERIKQAVMEYSPWRVPPVKPEDLPKEGDLFVYEFSIHHGHREMNVLRMLGPFYIWNQVLRFKIIERAK